MASEVVTAFQTIRSRSLNPREPSVITVGIIRGGERFNIIPAEVHLEGTVRTYSKETRDSVERRMGEILKGITLAYGGSYELDYNRGTPATINNPALTTQVVPSLERAIGKENVMAIPPTMGGEDFSFFSNIVPGFYYRLGMVKPGTVSGGHHTPTFRADDSCISVGMEAMSTLIVDFMKAGGLK
jgi:amidohydrolase